MFIMKILQRKYLSYRGPVKAGYEGDCAFSECTQAPKKDDIITAPCEDSDTVYQVIITSNAKLKYIAISVMFDLHSMKHFYSGK